MSGDNQMPNTTATSLPCTFYWSSIPSLRDGWIGGETKGANVSKSKRPVLDWAFSSQYRFSRSMMSDSSTV